MMSIVDRKIREISNCHYSAIPESVLNSKEPILLKGLVSEWPLVKAGLRSDDDVGNYLQGFYRGKPLTYYYGEPAIKGRLFYNDDFSGFNFERSQGNLLSILDLITENRDNDSPPMFYIGSTLVDEWLPGLRPQNDLALGEMNPLVSIWLGNRSIIPAHFDCPDNIACNVVGRRRFTLFPPDQLGNLYVGPLDITPSGRPISMVDLNAPDLEKYPKFANALKASLTAELEPGDAIFIPSMWWHHVEATDSLNVLVNYWWTATPAYMGNPENILHHALLGLKGLPKEKRDIWRMFFEYYIFNDSDEAIEHIPEPIRGVLSPVDELVAHKIRSRLINMLRR